MERIPPPSRDAQKGHTQMNYPYQGPFSVTTHMTDASGICRAADTIRILQEAAAAQLEERGPSVATLNERKQAFLLSRISVDLLLPMRAYARGTVTTWPNPGKGFVFDRCYTCEMHTPDGSFATVSAAAQWALINSETHALLRADDAPIDFTREERTTVSIPLRFRIPKDITLTEVGKKEVLYSDIDKNMHLNNTHYPDVYCDRLPMQGQRVTAIAISFQKEAPLGETLTVYRSDAVIDEAEPDVQTYYFRTVRLSDGQTNTEAVVKLKPIEA